LPFTGGSGVETPFRSGLVIDPDVHTNRPMPPMRGRKASL
jgi:hypothetical protein